MSRGLGQVPASDGERGAPRPQLHALTPHLPEWAEEPPDRSAYSIDTELPRWPDPSLRPPEPGWARNAAALLGAPLPAPFGADAADSQLLRRPSWKMAVSPDGSRVAVLDSHTLRLRRREDGLDAPSAGSDAVLDVGPAHPGGQGNISATAGQRVGPEGADGAYAWQSGGVETAAALAARRRLLVWSPAGDLLALTRCDESIVIVDRNGTKRADLGGQAWSPPRGIVGLCVRAVGDSAADISVATSDTRLLRVRIALGGAGRAGGARAISLSGMFRELYCLRPGPRGDCAAAAGAAADGRGTRVALVGLGPSSTRIPPAVSRAATGEVRWRGAAAGTPQLSGESHEGDGAADIRYAQHAVPASARPPRWEGGSREVNPRCACLRRDASPAARVHTLAVSPCGRRIMSVDVGGTMVITSAQGVDVHWRQGSHAPTLGGRSLDDDEGDHGDRDDHDREEEEEDSASPPNATDHASAANATRTGSDNATDNATVDEFVPRIVRAGGDITDAAWNGSDHVWLVRGHKFASLVHLPSGKNVLGTRSIRLQPPIAIDTATWPERGAGAVVLESEACVWRRTPDVWGTVREEAAIEASITYGDDIAAALRSTERGHGRLEQARAVVRTCQRALASWMYPLLPSARPPPPEDPRPLLCVTHRRRLLSLRPVGAMRVIGDALAAERSGEAFAIARAFQIDADHVRAAQWRHRAASDSEEAPLIARDVTDILGNLSTQAAPWLVREALARAMRRGDAMEALIETALRVDDAAREEDRDQATDTSSDAVARRRLCMARYRLNTLRCMREAEG